MTNVVVRWFLQAQNAVAQRWIVIDPSSDAVIGSVFSSGGNVYEMEACGPPSCPSHAKWCHVCDTLERAKADVLNTLRDFGWMIETAAEAPVQAPHPQENKNETQRG